MPDLLLELLCEEIPARMQGSAADQLASLVTAELAELGLAHGEPQAFATPRRLTLHLPGLQARQADRTVERRGPRVDAPEAARAGFLRSLAGLPFSLEERDDKKARVLFARVDEPGRPTAELLAEALPALLQRFSWPKSMRWGEGEARWVRPLRSILCLFDGAVVPFAFAGIASGAETTGHRFMAPAAFAVTGFEDYGAGLRRAHVVLDGAERRRLIREGARALAAGAGLTLREDEGLLDELAGLVEWPRPLLGRIDPAFMELPPEVLVTAMRTHQRYLALEHPDGSLAPAFVTVANIEAADGGAAIIAGNERVLRARLWDARFFWDQDKARPLEDLLPKLERVTFHAELGTQGERVRRLEQLAKQVFVAMQAPSFAAPPRPGEQRFDRAVEAGRAARLAKADLATGLVGEFPELQGIVGGHIAALQGEAADIAQAIAAHYAPKGDEPAPSAPITVALALADKLDSLVGFFGRAIRPTGSKDPFALRRSGLGVLKLVLENGLRLRMRPLLAAARALHGATLASTSEAGLADELLAFFADRLKVYLRDRGVRHDVLAAVFAAAADDDLVRLVERARAVQRFVDSDEGAILLAGYRRAVNILGIEEKKDGRRHAQAPERGRANAPAERSLFDALDHAIDLSGGDIDREEFGLAMERIARLRAPVDAFFEHVLVNDPDPAIRANRLRLLNRIREALAPIADFSLIEDTARPRPG